MYGQLSETLGLENTAGGYQKISDGEVEYTISDLSVVLENNSLGSGQVLHQPYTAEKARLVLREMADLLSLDLVGKRLVTNQLVVTIGYDKENLSTPDQKKQYH